MVGALINSAGIVLGGVLATALKKPIPAPRQNQLKIFLGAFTVWFGIRLTWMSLNGSFPHMVKQLSLVLLGMALGKLLGKLFGLQTMSNAVGQFATAKLGAGAARTRVNDGFLVATGLFCIGPLAVLGSVQEGLMSGFAKVFCVKAIMDGMATMAFSATFGGSVVMSAVPVLAFEGAIIQCVRHFEPVLRQQPQPIVDSINATTGLLIFCVALIILQLKKVAVADYLPSLVVVPLLTWWLW